MSTTTYVFMENLEKNISSFQLKKKDKQKKKQQSILSGAVTDLCSAR